MSERLDDQRNKSSFSLRAIRIFLGVTLLLSMLAGFQGELRSAAILIACSLAFACMHENTWILDADFRMTGTGDETLRRPELMVAAFVIAGGALATL